MGENEQPMDSVYLAAPQAGHGSQVEGTALSSAADLSDVECWQLGLPDSIDRAMAYEQLHDNEGVTLESEKPFAFKCCDCGLVHRMVIVSEDGRPVGFAVQRDQKATAEARDSQSAAPSDGGSATNTGYCHTHGLAYPWTHDCPACITRALALGTDIDTYIRDYRPREVSTAWRQRDFCGCNTNAAARACCELGKNADRRQAARDSQAQGASTDSGGSAQ